MHVPLFLTLAWLLAGVGLVRGSARLGGPRRGAWGLALLCAVVGVWVCERWLVGWHLQEWPVLARDFVQVCDATGRIRDGDWSGGTWPQRSPTSAALAGLGARGIGVIDGLRMSGALSLAACLIGLFAWACALGGPVAGASAVALALALAPVVVMPRALHVYAPSFAAWVLAAAAATWAARHRDARLMLVTGVAASLCLLLDGRGLVFALGALLAGLLGLPRGGARPRLLGAAALLLPVVGSWLVARVILPATTPPLETQALWFHMDVAGLDPGRPGPGWAHPEFLWGHSPPWTIPQTLATLSALGAATREAAPSIASTGLVPPIGLTLVALLGVARFAREHARTWIAALLTAIPFLAALGQALATQPHPRLLGGPAMVLALAGGLGFAALAAPREQRLIPAAVGGFWLLLAVGGAVPGLLHPDAGWRRPIAQLPDVGPLLALDPEGWPPEIIQGALDDPHCRATLEKDMTDGHPWGGRGLEWPRPE